MIEAKDFFTGIRSAMNAREHMMKQAFAVLAMLCMASLAMAGDVTYVASPSPALLPMSMGMQASQFETAPSEAGTVWAKAMVGKVLLSGTDKPSTIQVALDAETADATEPNVIRFNFDGKAQFTKELSLPLKVTMNQPALWVASFGPKVMEIQRGDKTVPLRVEGHCFKQNVNQNGKTVEIRRVGLTVISTIQTDVTFGDKIHAVRLVDANGNFNYADPARPIITKDAAYFSSGDAVAIDTGDGKFGKVVEKCFFGQPVRVDGKWYKVAASDDGTKVSAEPLDAPIATIKVDSDQWDCRLVSKDAVLILHGGKDAVEVPAGEYYIHAYTLTGPKAWLGQTPMIVGSGLPLENNQMKPVTLEAGKTGDLQIGAPFKASVKSTVNGNNVVFSLVFADRGGHRSPFVSGNNGRPAAPKFSVVDSSGKEVYQNTLEYG